MNRRPDGIETMKAFCTLLYQKFFAQLNRKLKIPKTIGINGIDVKSLEQLETAKATAVTKTTNKIIKRVVKPSNNAFVIGDQTTQNFVGCGFFPIGFVTKLFIFETGDGTIYVPRMAKENGEKVIAFARKLQKGYDFEVVTTKQMTQSMDEGDTVQPQPVDESGGN